MKPKLTSKQRQALLLESTEGRKTVVAACWKAGISRTLFYRWVRRYRQKGTFEPKPAGRPVSVSFQTSVRARRSAFLRQSAAGLLRIACGKRCL